MPPLADSRRMVLLVPGAIDTRTGGYAYDRRIVDGLRGRGWDVQVRELDHSFPFPTPAALDHATRVLGAVEPETIVVVDGLALGAMPAVVAPHAARLALVALVHHPLAFETGLRPDAAAALRVSERQALRGCRVVIVTSRATAERLGEFDVPSSRIVVAEPGSDIAPLARASAPDEPVHLLTVATLVPRKGHETLVRALARLRDRRWRLTCVGSLSRHPDTVARVHAAIAEAGLEERVRLTDELDDAALEAQYATADLFVLPTFHEGYGMVVGEALAHGVPVVSTRTGGIADLLESEGSGLTVPAGDDDELAAVLGRLIDDRSWLDSLREGAIRAREKLPRWDDTVRLVEQALHRGPGAMPGKE